MYLKESFTFKVSVFQEVFYPRSQTFQLSSKIRKTSTFTVSIFKTNFSRKLSRYLTLGPPQTKNRNSRTLKKSCSVQGKRVCFMFMFHPRLHLNLMPAKLYRSSPERTYGKIFVVALFMFYVIFNFVIDSDPSRR